MSRTLITVAPTGAEVDKASWPQLPTTLTELVAEAKACESAGAAMIHVHIRDDEHRPTLDLGRLRETVAALRENTGLIVQLSTGGSVHDPLDARLAVLDAAPDSCSLTCGTVNFGDDVFSNPWPFITELYRRTQFEKVVPEFELFDLGHVATLERLLDKYGLPAGGKVHADLVLGVPGGLPATVPALVNAVQALPEAVTSWSATGIGRGHLPILAASLAMGGHVRVGLEDNLFFAPRRPATANAELVARAAALANHLQRPAMSPAQARELIGL
ncbi:BKACE family enzyme [Kineosporia babensis]|uniref:3-keto-5-aminohexanoate cleavage protein n=1 Tax=Kineosporia babensis TaxID=499548 RepID=A0A9X1N8U6_9ACTN|nr:3-keto-5-aminohexanoate cleavage protein [Kineosporia babensis]MCD5309289.1 3-keto-5-aminohexanoate cleavage protein [Kineosporia babensis]